MFILQSADNTGIGKISGPSWEQVETALSQLDAPSRPFLILTDDITGSYMQCAGNRARLTVELRRQVGESFKHFVVKRIADPEPPIVWTEIQVLGAIHLHVSEVLQFDDAVVLFKSFFQRSDLPPAYRTRNVTKMFLKN